MTINAEIITIGDELLIGRVIDTNSAFIGKALTQIGIEVVQITSIKDDSETILKTLKTAESQAEVVLITGGLGPTKDDRTKAAFCTYFQDHLVTDKKVLKHVGRLLHQAGSVMLPANIAQAQVPSKAQVLFNQYGTAPGMWIEKEGTVFIALPGVPFETKNLIAQKVVPQLSRRFKRPFILQKTLLTYGIGESQLADKIKNWENQLPQNMSLAYLPEFGRVKLRLMIRGEERESLEKELQQKIQELHQLIGAFFGGFEDGIHLAERIAQTLTSSHQTLATAESCTGGELAREFTAIPGASKYYKGGVIPYQTAMKTELLGIDPDIIEQHSVVSAAVAREMAIRTRALFKADYAISTTGNAGPTKGDSQAEIGTVFIAISSAEKTIVKEYHLGKNREAVVHRAIHKALPLLYSFLHP